MVYQRRVIPVIKDCVIPVMQDRVIPVMKDRVIPVVFPLQSLKAYHRKTSIHACHIYMLFRHI